MNPEQTKKLLGVIGLCKGAGKLIIGVPMICDAMRTREKNRVRIVIEASDTSENTHKRITDKCAFYGVRVERVDADCQTLGHAVGKRAVAAVAVTDENLCRAVEAKLYPTETNR